MAPRFLAVAAALILLPGCGKAPIFEAMATGSTGKNGGTSLSIPVPASTQGQASGDLLVAVLGVKVNPPTSGPSGWTAVSGMGGFNGATCASDQEGIACQLTVFYKLASGSETSASFSWGSTYQAAGAVLRYSRIDASSPIGDTGIQNGTSSSPTAPSVTTVRSESRVLSVALSEADDVRDSLTDLVLGGAPTTPRFNLVSFPAASVDPSNGCGPPLSGCSYIMDAVGLAASDIRRKTAGATPTVSWTLPGNDQWVAVTIEIKRPPDTGVVVQ
jgi:hypothetical protein